MSYYMRYLSTDSRPITPAAMRDALVARLDPLWVWLFQNRDGLLQADSEGYYDRRGIIFRME